MLRRCGACKKRKELREFAWRRREKGQRDNYCRGCRAEYKQRHYAANKQRYISNAARRRTRVLEENLDRLIEFLAAHPCVDCGETDPLVLEFDHIGDKSFMIAKAVRERPWASIEREIAEREVVCANCHRRRTARRGGYARAARIDGARAPTAEYGND